MNRFLVFPMLVALLALSSLVPSASVAQESRAPIAVITDLPPVAADEFAPAPVPPAAPAPAAEEDTGGFVSAIAGAIGRLLGDGLYYVVGLAGAWVMGMMGFKEWTAAKVQEALHNEKMKPYSDGVIRIVIDWLARTLNRQPKVLEVLQWIGEQFPEVRNWIGRTDKERIGYLQTFLDAPGPAMTSDASVGTGSARAAGSSPRSRRPKPRPVAKVDPLKPPVGATTPATA